MTARDGEYRSPGRKLPWSVTVECRLLGFITLIYAEQAAAWGATPLEDQQLAGLAMWVPAGVVFTGASLACLAAWLRVSARRVDVRPAWRVGGECP